MQLRANFNWKLTLFVVIFLPLTLRLGFWQLDRAEQKRQMAADFAALEGQPALNIQQLDSQNWQNYMPAKVQGVFDTRVFLLDNQIYKSKFGYEVIQPLVLENKQIILVSRGFVAGSLDRSQLPEIRTPAMLVHLQGYLYQPSENLALGENAFSGKWPEVIQSPAVEKLYKHLSKSDKIANHFLLRLKEDSPYSYQAHWQIINVRPEKHTAYAVQWFAMGGLLVLMFIYASIKVTKSEAR